MTLLADFLADPSNQHAQAGNPSVACNALYKTRQNLNCYLTPSQAIELARHLLEKAQLILDNEIEDAAVQVWNQGEQNEKIYLGLTKARKGPRRKKKAPETVGGEVPDPARASSESITRQRIDELLQFLPQLGTPGPHTEPTWPDMKPDPTTGGIPWPHPEYPQVVEDFFELAAQPWWRDYEYAAFKPEVVIQDDVAIASATLPLIKSLLTHCVRGENFSEGHWGEMVQSGRVGAILRRLAQLRDTVPDA